VWQGHLLDLLGRRSEALRSYRRALEDWRPLRKWIWPLIRIVLAFICMVISPFG
jgi:hypothetical protein